MQPGHTSASKNADTLPCFTSPGTIVSYFQYPQQRQPRRAGDSLCSSQEHLQTSGGRMGHAMKGFSVPALSMAAPLSYYSCSIYLRRVSTFLPYYMQFTLKSLIFPLADKRFPLWKFRVSLQELSRALFHEFYTPASAADYPRKIKDVEFALMGRERWPLNTLLTELNEEGVGGSRGDFTFNLQPAKDVFEGTHRITRPKGRQRPNVSVEGSAPPPHVHGYL